MTEKCVLSLTDISLEFEFVKSRSIRNDLLRIFKFDNSHTKHKIISAVNSISFCAKEGEKIGVIGNNGAGKTTLLRLIAGVYEPDSGIIERYGNSTALLSLGTGFQKELNGVQNIYINALLLGMTINDIRQNIKDIIDFSELGDAINHPVRTYSSGMRARLAFSIAVYINPDILLIDEALGVGDSKFKRKSTERINELIHSGKTIIIVSHRLKFLRELCDKVLWLDNGKMVMFGDSNEVIDAYEK